MFKFLLTFFIDIIISLFHLLSFIPLELLDWFIRYYIVAFA